MTESSLPVHGSSPEADPARRAAVRGMLIETVDASVASPRLSGRRRLVGFVSLAATAVVVLVVGGIAFSALHPSAGPHGGTAVAPSDTSDPQPSVSGGTPTSVPPSGLVDPAGTPSPTPILPADPAPLLLSAPVPSLCQHPAGTLSQGTFPGQSDMSGYVKLSQFADTLTPASRYYAAGPVTGVGDDAVAASVSCNAGGVPWPDVIVFYRSSGTALELIGSFSLDTLAGTVAVTTGVTIVDDSVLVTFSGPAAGQPDSDGSRKQSARFTVSGSTIVPSGYTADRR